MRLQGRRRNQDPETYDVTNIGWNEGTLENGTSDPIECWATEGITTLTFFVPRNGLEKATGDELRDLLVENGRLTFSTDRPYVSAGRWTNDEGQEMWSVNVVVGDRDEMFADSPIPLRRYSP